MKIKSPFDFLYQLEHEEDKKIFGEAYSPPKEWSHCGWHKIVSYPKHGEDGQPVEIYEARAPAKFYKLVALESGDKKKWSLHTGSGKGIPEMIFQMAQMVTQGMLGMDEEEN